MTVWLRGFVLCGALALTACIMRPGPGSDQANPTGNGNGSGGSAAIVVQNNSGTTICFVNFSSAQSSDWGGDQLGSSETIAAGGSRSWSVNAGSWDVRAQDCQHGLLAEHRGIAVSGSTQVTVP